ncbi:hypothetical protein CDL12_17209 [Handroanthus impetiginosus]|uniref:Uncharacterized protein n=1 Tax=Handroanthus impetiginosus TaxID=429701 RepID=A0A2G9GY75_9LAMI|nr:hypothetical protein CDL12_17209 [Handroanthus impetiginosus]
MAVGAKVQIRCKIRGYDLEIEVLPVIHEFVTHFPGGLDQDEALDVFLDEYFLSHNSYVLDKERVHGVVRSLLEAWAIINEM